MLADSWLNGRSIALGSDARVPQQGVHRWGAATESQVEVHGVHGAALLQDVLPKAGSRGRVEDTALLEEREGIRRQDLGPLVAVIASPVAAGKDVGKAVGEAMKAGGFITATRSRTESRT